MPPPVTRTFHRFACSSQFRWGALLMQVGQDEAKSFCFKATHPCIYVYHCAGLHLLTHIANGMYGMILVEPELRFGKSRPRVLPDAEQFLHQWHAIDKSALARIDCGRTKLG